MRPFTGQKLELLRAVADLSIEDAHIIKKFEREGHEGIPATNHDVKAVEYFMKLKLRERASRMCSNGCTSRSRRKT